MCYRRTENTHHTIADMLVDTSAFASDDSVGPGKIGIENLVRGFRSQILGEACVADEIGEQHRDHAPFLALGPRDLETAVRAEPGPGRKRL